MEQILTNESNIPARITWLKPVSSAFAIGTGGPFGAEGPIVSTGGAMGSLIGQPLRVTANQRTVLLEAGAAPVRTALCGDTVSSPVVDVDVPFTSLSLRSVNSRSLTTLHGA